MEPKKSKTESIELTVINRDYDVDFLCSLDERDLDGYIQDTQPTSFQRIFDTLYNLYQRERLNFDIAINMKNQAMAILSNELLEKSKVFKRCSGDCQQILDRLCVDLKEAKNETKEENIKILIGLLLAFDEYAKGHFGNLDGF